MKQKHILIILLAGALIAVVALVLNGNEAPSAPVAGDTSAEANREGTEDVTATENSSEAGMVATSGEQSAEAPAATETKDEYAGTHIMPDGTIMMEDGTVLPDAVIQTDGTILLTSGAVITPAFDMRKDVEVDEADAAQEVVIDMVGTNFAYDIKQFTVKKGDTVTVNFVSDEGFHDWVVDEFEATTQRVNEGGATSVTFVADEVGRFQYYCSVGSHREQGMVGYLVVEER